MQSLTFADFGVFSACLIVVLGAALTLKLLLRRDPPLHKEYAGRDETAKLEKKIEAADAWARSARKGTYERLDDHHARISTLEQGAARVAQLEQKIDENSSLTAETRGEVRQINQNVVQLQQSLAQFMRDSAKR